MASPARRKVRRDDVEGFLRMRTPEVELDRASYESAAGMANDARRAKVKDLKDGAGDGDRTRDIQLGKLAFYR